MAQLFTRLLLGVVMAVTWVRAQMPLGVCDVLNASSRLKGRTIAVQGFLNGSTQHGYVLFESASMGSEPCSNWPKRYFTAPSIIALGVRGDSNPVLSAMKRRHAEGDLSAIKVNIIGKVHRKWLSLIFRTANGGYAGNGFGESGGKAVLIEVESIQPLLQPTQIIDRRPADGKRK